MQLAYKNIVAAVIVGLIAWPECAQAQTLGRLFYSPQERRELDANRNAQPIKQALVKPFALIKPAAATDTQPNSYTPPPPTKTTVINGFVRRSDGPNTVWLNEKPLSGNAAREEWLQPSAVNSPVRVQSTTR